MNQNFLRIFQDFNFKISTPEVNAILEDLEDLDVRSTYQAYVDSVHQLFDLNKSLDLKTDFSMLARKSTLLHSDEVFRNFGDYLFKSLCHKLEMVSKSELLDEATLKSQEGI